MCLVMVLCFILEEMNILRCGGVIRVFKKTPQNRKPLPGWWSRKLCASWVCSFYWYLINILVEKWILWVIWWHKYFHVQKMQPKWAQYMPTWVCFSFCTWSRPVVFEIFLSTLIEVCLEKLAVFTYRSLLLQYSSDLQRHHFWRTHSAFLFCWIWWMRPGFHFPGRLFIFTRCASGLTLCLFVFPLY